jgi:hypothetical protein
LWEINDIFNNCFKHHSKTLHCEWRRRREGDDPTAITIPETASVIGCCIGSQSRKLAGIPHWNSPSLINVIMCAFKSHNIILASTCSFSSSESRVSPFSEPYRTGRYASILDAPNIQR